MFHVGDEAQGEEHRAQVKAQPLRGTRIQIIRIKKRESSGAAERRDAADVSGSTHVQKHAGRVGHHHGGEGAEPQSALENICGGGGVGGVGVEAGEKASV